MSSLTMGGLDDCLFSMDLPALHIPRCQAVTHGMDAAFKKDAAYATAPSMRCHQIRRMHPSGQAA